MSKYFTSHLLHWPFSSRKRKGKQGVHRPQPLHAQLEGHNPSLTAGPSGVESQWRIPLPATASGPAPPALPPPLPRSSLPGSGIRGSGKIGGAILSREEELSLSSPPPGCPPWQPALPPSLPAAPGERGRSPSSPTAHRAPSELHHPDAAPAPPALSPPHLARPRRPRSGRGWMESQEAAAAA